MFRWLHRICGEPADAAPPLEDSDPDRLRAERRRLEEMLVTYREFGFDAMAEECRARLARIRHRLPCPPKSPSLVSRR